ncbi:class I SAM-dependent methyltransferase [Stenotrophomonas sp.]|uniref:class I SAM-dependent methyltransferase n=1 Tax=Stenotrophomonas sp. TaxID=69392 RepID=UPI00289C57A3|nr:class I SAM-dependent methyltransferase [Stenotrophomonas sp.]
MTDRDMATFQVGEQCPACLQMMRPGLQPWHRVCSRCTYEGSTLLVDIDVAGTADVVDEAMREEGLNQLRQSNFEALEADIARRVTAAGGERPRLLDVGCAHGWFLEAGRPDFEVLGIEPDAKVADAAVARGLPVRRGFFPDVLDASEQFDVIVFNDVLEHIPDIGAALRACMRHLQPGGWVIVNAPARTGVLYRFSVLMARLGLPASFERLWQKGLPSPHVHYLDDDSMQAIAGHAAMQVAAVRTLPSLTARGLYARIRADRSVPAAKAMLVASVLSVASPALRILPADIKVWMLQAKG